MTATLKKLWHNEYIQTIVVIGLVASGIFGFWYGLQMVLNTPYPALAVISGSMCVPYNGACDGWSHPFAYTLHIGDLIIVQGVKPRELSVSYPNSDIIVFKKPSNPDELIVHRVVVVNEINGTLYFRTKGDGNSHVKWPNIPSTLEYDPWSTEGIPGIREDYVVGKVVIRIPWLGHLVLFMRNSVGLPLIGVLIIILVLVEFIIPLFKEKQKQAAQLSP